MNTTHDIDEPIPAEVLAATPGAAAGAPDSEKDSTEQAGVRYALVGNGRRIHYSPFNDDTLCGRTVTDYPADHEVLGLLNKGRELCGPCIKAADKRAADRGEQAAAEQAAEIVTAIQNSPHREAIIERARNDRDDRDFARCVIYRAYGMHDHEINTVDWGKVRTALLAAGPEIAHRSDCTCMGGPAGNDRRDEHALDCPARASAGVETGTRWTPALFEMMNATESGAVLGHRRTIRAACERGWVTPVRGWTEVPASRYQRRTRATERVWGVVGHRVTQDGAAAIAEERRRRATLCVPTVESK